MSKDKVSFLIVTWNNAQIIADCIDTLFTWCPTDNQVIVVDNDSQDSTCAVIRERYGDKVILIEAGENLGFSKANNRALQEATGDYIFYVNPDVVFVEDIITPMLEVLKENPQVGIVSPRLIYPDGSYQVSTCNFPSPSKVFWGDMQLYKLLPKTKQRVLAQAQYEGTDARFVDWTYGAAQLCRYEDVAKVGGYPNEFFLYGEDIAFCMSILKKLEKKTYYLGSSKLIHLGGYSEKQVVTPRKPALVAKSSMYFVKKYYGEARLLGYRILLFIAALLKHGIFSAKCLFCKSQKNANGKTKWGTTWKTVLHWQGELQ